MGIDFLKGLKNFVNPVDTEEDYEDDGYEYPDDNNGYGDNGYEDEYVQPQQQQQPRRQQQMQQNQPQNQSAQNTEGSYDYYDQGSNSQVDIRKVPVEKWADVQTISDHLAKHRLVFIDISAINTELARRVLDFICGVCYVIKGKLQKVDSKTWLATPANVNFTTDKKPRPQNRPNEMFIDPDDVI